MAKKQKSNKIASKIPHWVEAFVAELSLKHPDYGARRLLPLLEQEGITLTNSAVYTILKRNNLQNRPLRLAKLEAKRATETAPAAADTTLESAEQPDQVPAFSAEKKPERPVSLAIKPPPKIKVRRPWSLSPANILLLGLVGYFWVSALGNLLEARREPILQSVLAPPAVESTPQATVRPLEDYKIIVERNLFGAPQGQAAAPQGEVSLEDIPAAGEGLGLKLVGTVAGDDAATSFAIIDNKKTRKQELYHEGDKAGDVLIKRILRNIVIIDAGRGDEVLTLELAESGKKIDFAPAPQPQVDIKPAATGRSRPSFQLDRKEVQSSLANVDELIQRAGISPYLQGEQPAGFTIANIDSRSVLAKMGLRSGDSIMGVNGEAITGPEQAAEFFQKLKEGGDLTIKVRKGTGVRRRPRVMRLSIE